MGSGVKYCYNIARNEDSRGTAGFGSMEAGSDLGESSVAPGTESGRVVRERMEVRKGSVRTDSVEDPAWTCGCWWSWGRGRGPPAGPTPAWCWRKGLEERPGCDSRAVGFLLVRLGPHEDCVSGPGVFMEGV